MATMPTMEYTVKVNSKPVEERCHDDYHHFVHMTNTWLLYCGQCGMTLRVTHASGS